MSMIATLREVRAGDLEWMGNPEQVLEALSHDDPMTLSLEKAWHGLDELLAAAGTAPELGFAIVGGRDVPDALNLGWRLLSADFVRRLDTALRGIDDDQLWAGYNAERFEAEGIYPGIWDEPPDELRDEYVGYFNDLKAFVGRVAAAGGEIAVAVM